jgi:peroxiredoxin
MMPRVRPLAALSVLALLLFGGCSLWTCGDSGPASATDSVPESAPPPTAATAAPAEAPAPAPQRQERPLPAFDGVTLDGDPFSVTDLLGRRALLFFFDPNAREAGAAAEAVGRVAAVRDRHNFDVVGIALNAGAESTRAFASEHGLEFRILDDPAAAIASRIGLRAPVALIGADAEGYVTFAVFAPPPDATDAADIVENQLREALRLPATHVALEPTLGVRPTAPLFEAERLEGGEPFALSSLSGRPVVLIFFLFTCPHCHHALEFLEQELPKIPEEQRPQLVGVSVAGSPSAVSEALEQQGLDFFPVLLDLDGSLRSTYGVVAGVPDIFVIDADGTIVSRTQGWRADRDPALLRMRLARIAKQPVPLLLHSTGYSGSEACGVCHEKEQDAWLLTSHAHAFDTLVRHAADANPECVGCHVVGFGQSGGYTISPRTPDFENVGCETCHGRGGPHLSPAFVSAGNYEPVCVTCHDQKHSLGFEYASFLPKVSHAANAELATLPLEQRRALLAERAGPRSSLLPTNAPYVGSDACRSCHEKEFATWAASPHGHSLASLEAKGEATNPTCQRCHVTALGLPGGFPAPAKDSTPSSSAIAPSDHADLARVGCESCHGPGGAHIGENAPRIGTIVSLGDKCDSCVILQICGSCHDQDNDPGFEFEVQQKIERQKHGTIEASATRGAGSAAFGHPEPGLLGALERGFALLDTRD